MEIISGGVATLVSPTIRVIMWAGGAILAILFLGVIAWIVHSKKKWNLRLEIKLPRSDGQLVLSDSAKGHWDNKNGWIVVKRKGFRAIPTHPIDPKKWLRGRNFATLIQVGPEDFIIASEDSYLVVKDAEGNDQAVMKIVADVGKRKTWKNYTERMGKKAFTLVGWLEQHQFLVALGIVCFIMFIGFALLWSRQGELIKSICSAPVQILPK